MRERNHKLAGAVLSTMMSLFPSQQKLTTTSKTKQEPLVDVSAIRRRLIGGYKPRINGAKECARRRRQMAAGTMTPNYAKV